MHPPRRTPPIGVPIEAPKRTLRDLLEDWKFIIGALVTVLFTGVSIATISYRYITKTDAQILVEEKVNHHAEVTKPDDYYKRVYDVEARVRVLEDYTSGDKVDKQWIKSTIYDIARRVGANPQRPPEPPLP